MTNYAFFGGSELLVIALVGLLVFGGRLPEVMREIGKVWFGFRRTVNDLKRETGFDEAVRDIKREAQVSVDLRDIKKDMDPFAGPAKSDEPQDVELESGPMGKRTPRGAVSQEAERVAPEDEPAGEDAPADEEAS
jgi:Sec-independent protein translocase protein TatA